MKTFRNIALNEDKDSSYLGFSADGQALNVQVQKAQ